MAKRRSYSSGPAAAQTDDMQTNPLKVNADLTATNLKLADRQKDLQDRIDKLTTKNKSLTRKLNEIFDLTESDDNAEDLIDDIADIAQIDGNGGNGNGGGNGGNGNGDDDDD